MYFHTPDITYTCIGHPRWIYVMIKKNRSPSLPDNNISELKEIFTQTTYNQAKMSLTIQFPISRTFSRILRKKMFGPLDFLMFFFLHFFKISNCSSRNNVPSWLSNWIRCPTDLRKLLECHLLRYPIQITLSS